MRKPELLIRILAAISVLAVPAAQGTPAADESMPAAVDYAWDWPVETDAPADFYELELPLAVYQSVADPGLRDIGVYNSDWQPVPRIVGPPAEPKAAEESRVSLVALPVRAPPGTEIGDMRLALERSDDGTSVRIESVAPATGSRPETIVAYVTDLGESRSDLRAIEIEWPREIEPLIARLSIDGSPDFERWHPLGHGTVAGLRQGQSHIERGRIGLAGEGIRYLRISWDEVPGGWKVSRLVAFHAPPAPEIRREWLSLPSSGRDPADGGYLFEIGGSPPVDRIALELPDDNSLILADIHVWNPDTRGWRLVHSGSFYRLRRNGGAIASEPESIVAQRSSRWKVRIERGAGELQFALKFGWRSDRLHFIAQGRGPWVVAAGNAEDAAQGFPQERRYGDPAMRGLLEKSVAVGKARLGPREELGGPERLEAARAPEWRRWLLWLGLAGGVALVGFMALRLLRQSAA